jgi:hypothetical protein
MLIKYFHETEWARFQVRYSQGILEHELRMGCRAAKSPGAARRVSRHHRELRAIAHISLRSCRASQAVGSESPSSDQRVNLALKELDRGAA